MIFSRIDFIKSTNVLTLPLNKFTIFPAIHLRNGEVVGDPFFDDFMRVQNTINEFSLYFIRVYDENSNHVYSGLMKRTDYSVDEEQETIDITAKDFGVLLSAVKNQSISVGEAINLGLDDRATMYDYYINQSSLYYFNNDSDLQRQNNFEAEIKIETLEYASKSIKMIDIINIFTSANNHTIRTELETVTFEDNEYNDTLTPTATILDSDVIDVTESSVTIGGLDLNIITSTLKDDTAYQDEIITIVTNSRNRFASSVDTKLKCEVSSIINTYDLSINQIIRVLGKSFNIKSIKEENNFYSLSLWNAKNNPTVAGGNLWIGLDEFDTTKNGQTVDNIWIGLDEDNTNQTINNLWIGTDEDNTNQTVNNIWIGTD